jgi:hypothetical protein
LDLIFRIREKNTMIKFKNYDKVKSFKRCGLWVNAQRTYFYPYVIEAEEGIIDPKWELTKNTKEWSWLKS